MSGAKKAPKAAKKPAKDATPTKTAQSPKHPARLKELYKNELRAQLQKDLKLKSIDQTPKLRKIVVSSGLGKVKDDKSLIEVATNTVTKITGQKPIVTKARMSIATFKLREGDKVGIKTTLRDERMYEFMDRLINIVIPRLRDFHGVSNKSFDSQGNYSIGFRDQSIFPELTFEETTKAHGIQVTFVVDSSDKEHSRALLGSFGMPYMKEGK